MPHLSPREIAFEYETRQQQQMCVRINDDMNILIVRAPRVESFPSSKVHREHSERFVFTDLRAMIYYVGKRCYLRAQQVDFSKQIRRSNEFCT